jgi:hypothetical protein
VAEHFPALNTSWNIAGAKLGTGQGSNFIAAIAVEGENKMPWIIAATAAIFCRIV